MSSEIPTFEAYLSQREIYLQNAIKFKNNGRLRKASELLWGAITQTLKAYAFLFDKIITTHGQFFTFTKEVAKEQGDETIYTGFLEVNSLHRNFYDDFIPVDSFPSVFSESMKYQNKIDALIIIRIKEIDKKSNIHLDLK